MAGPQQRLFFALRPPPAVGRSVAALAAALGDLPRVRWLDPAHYHVTVHFLGNHAGDFPPGLVAGALRAATALNAAPFAIALDRLDSFPARGPSPLILRSDAASDAALGTFRERLGRALREELALPADERPFVPHLTIGYGVPRAAAPIAPFAWQVTRFELVASRSGRHETLGVWPLRLA